MATNRDDPDFEPAHTSSPTDHVLAELQLYRSRPFQDEPDPRPLPEADAQHDPDAAINIGLSRCRSDMRRSGSPYLGTCGSNPIALILSCRKRRDSLHSEADAARPLRGSPSSVSIACGANRHQRDCRKHNGRQGGRPASIRMALYDCHGQGTTLRPPDRPSSGSLATASGKSPPGHPDQVPVDDTVSSSSSSSSKIHRMAIAPRPIAIVRNGKSTNAWACLMPAAPAGGSGD